MIGKLVQFNSKFFEGDMKEFGCGLVLTEPSPLLLPRPRLHPRPRPRPRSHQGRPRPTDNWVEVLWDGKVFCEYANYLAEIKE